MMRRTGIYVREGDEHVGPFSSRQDAERFLLLMELFGNNCEGIDIVELGIARRPRSINSVTLSHSSRSREKAYRTNDSQRSLFLSSRG